MPKVSGKISRAIAPDALDFKGRPLFSFRPKYVKAVNDTIRVTSSGLNWFHCEFYSNSSKQFNKLTLSGRLEIQADGSVDFYWENDQLKSSKKEPIKRALGLLRDSIPDNVRIKWDGPRMFCNHLDVWRSIPQGYVFLYQTYSVVELVNKILEQRYGEKEERPRHWVRKRAERLVEILARGFHDPKLYLNSSIFSDRSTYEHSLFSTGNTWGVFKKHIYGESHYRNGNPKWLLEKVYVVVGKNSHNAQRVSVRMTPHGLIEVRREISVSALRKANPPFDLQDLHKFVISIREDEVNGAYASDTDLSKFSNESSAKIVQEFVKAVATAILVSHYAKESGGEQNKNTDVESLIEELFLVSGNDCSYSVLERQRYELFLLSDLKCSEKGHPIPHSINADRLYEDGVVINTLLDSTIDHSDSEHGKSSPAHVRPFLPLNLASWLNELCVLNAERGLILFDPATVQPKHRSIVNYEDYWLCIARAIQHTISVRTLLHVVESQSARLPSQLAKLVELSSVDLTQTPRTVNSEIKRELQILSEDVSAVQKYLPTLREISVASSVFSESEIVKKFNYLNTECFHFPEVLSHIQQTVNETTELLQFYKQQVLTIQMELERDLKSDSEKKLAGFGTISALVIAFIAIVLGFPSILQAFRQAIEKEGLFDYITYFAAFLSFIFLICIIPYSRFYLKGDSSRKTYSYLLKLVFAIFLVWVLIFVYRLFSLD